MLTSPPLRATYRLQLNKDFTFADAAARVPYLSELGISHVYLSPILMARPGSTHGYDTVDHTRINPELGTIEGFRRLVADVRRAEMGVVLDFVPNHMGVGGAHNGLWLDMLKHGPDSRYADWFDIDWHSPREALQGRVMVPFLGKTYAQSLADGDLDLRHDDDGFAVWANGSEKLPIRPQDEADLLAAHADPQMAIAATHGPALDALIERQHWRLAHYAAAGDEINYRRFFINSDLAGIRIDRPDVFDHAHGLIFDLIGEGLVDGLRIDHVDGLLDPKAYMETLQAKAPRPIYLAIEKILAPHEQLRADWPVDGTTGYEFGAQLTRLLMPEASEDAMTAAYEAFAGPAVPPEEEAYRCKLRVMDNELAAELATLARHLAAVAWSVASTRDLTEMGLRRAIREVIAHLTVYRPYIDAAGVPAQDAREVGLAIAKARRACPFQPPAGFDFIAALLLGQLSSAYDPKLVATAIGKLQQYTGPVMAKGLEDTALYRYNRMVALNEVGAHPDRFAISVEAFHDANQHRLARHPDCMLATSTHDTKRGEDTRAILGAAAEHPERWSQASTSWRELLAVDGDDAIHANDLYLFFQLLLGGWPAFGDAEGLAERLKGAMQKSLREARQRSDWAFSDTDYEQKVDAFIDGTLANGRFIERFLADRADLLETGLRKALVQVVLKLTVPGMPDIYRGAEDWEQSFVDPDNRRPVDFAELAERLAAPRFPRDDKLVLTQALLQLRKRDPELFSRGSYMPVERGAKIIAFRRATDSTELLVIADLTGRGKVDPEPGWNSVLDGTSVSSALQSIFVGYRSLS